MTVGKLVAGIVALLLATVLLTTCAVNSCSQPRVVTQPVSVVGPAPVVHAAPVAAAPVVVHHGSGGSDFAAGMAGGMIGSMIANGGGGAHRTVVNRTTIVKNTTVKRPTYVRRTKSMGNKSYSGFRRRR